MSVLLVDDDDISNYLNKRVVEKSGYFKRVDICNSAQAAIKMLTERKEADRTSSTIDSAGYYDARDGWVCFFGRVEQTFCR